MNPLGRGLSAVDAVGNSHAVIGVAGQLESRPLGRFGFDLGHELAMSQVILGHRVRPAGNVTEQRRAAGVEERTQLFDGEALELLVVQLGQLALASPRPRTREPTPDRPARGR